MTDQCEKGCSESDLEILRLKKEIWEKAIDTQMHFNEMSVKSRQLGLSLIIAAIGLSAVLIGRNEGVYEIQLSIIHEIVSISMPGVIILISAFGLYAVMLLDLGVYHQMLRGAVKFGEDLERNSIRPKLMNTAMGMTEYISAHSRHDGFSIDPESGAQTFKKTALAASKIGLFYFVSFAFLGVIGISVILIFFHSRHIPVQAAKDIRNSTLAVPSTGAATTNQPDLSTLKKGHVNNGLH